jgi:hypothetical protein
MERELEEKVLLAVRTMKYKSEFVCLRIKVR